MLDCQTGAAGDHFCYRFTRSGDRVTFPAKRLSRAIQNKLFISTSYVDDDGLTRHEMLAGDGDHYKVASLLDTFDFLHGENPTAICSDLLCDIRARSGR